MNSELNPELISSYLDGELASKEERERVEQHLASSPEGTRLLAEFRQMGDLLRELPQETIPAGLCDAVRHQLERETLLAPSTNAASPQSGWMLSRLSTAKMLVSASLALLLVTVGTFYYMQDQFNGTAETHLIATNDNKPNLPDHVELDESSDPSSTFAFKTQPEAMKSKMSIGKGGGTGFTADAPPQTAMQTTSEKSVLATLDHRDEIPPLPAVLSKRSVGYINTLAASPKIQGLLEPGELVRYVSNNSVEQNVSVVELSVVDVEEAFGTIQVLLSSNQIVSADKLAQIVGQNQLKPAPVQAQNPTAVVAKKGAEKDNSVDKTKTPLAKKTNGLTQKELKTQIANQGMIAVYVEASQEQVLNCLTQANTLENVHTVNFGNSVNLSEPSYDIEPLVQNGFVNINISRHDMQPALGINQKPAPSASHKSRKMADSHDLKSKTNSVEQPLFTQTNTAPQWRVLHQPPENLAAPAPVQPGESVAGATAQKSKAHSQSRSVTENKVASAGTKFVTQNGKKVLVPQAVLVAGNALSYQYPVRLLPQRMVQSHQQQPTATVVGSPNDSKNSLANTPTKPKQAQPFSKLAENAKGDETVFASKNVQQNKNNRLRMLLIISLKED